MFCEMWSLKFVHYQLCFEFISSFFCTSDVSVNVNLFFIWKGISAEAWTSQKKSVFVNNWCIFSPRLEIKYKITVSTHLIQKGTFGTCSGVFMFLSSTHFMFLFFCLFSLNLALIWFEILLRLLLVQKISEKINLSEWKYQKDQTVFGCKEMLCHMPAVYNVNYLLNKRKCLVSVCGVAFHWLPQELFVNWVLPQFVGFDCPLLFVGGLVCKKKHFHWRSWKFFFSSVQMYAPKWGLQSCLPIS